MKPNTCLVIDVWEGQLEIDETVLKANGVAQINARLDFIRQALKLAAAAIINMRGLFVLTAKLLIYIRDIVIRFRGA